MFLVDISSSTINKDTVPFGSFLDIYFEFEEIGFLSTSILVYARKDDFNFEIMNSLHLSSNITTSP